MTIRMATLLIDDGTLLLAVHSVRINRDLHLTEVAVTIASEDNEPARRRPVPAAGA